MELLQKSSFTLWETDLGFEADLQNFFLGCLTVQLMKINLLLSIVAAIFCYSLMVLRSKLDSQPEIGTLRMEDHVGIEIDSADGGERGGDNHNQQIQSLRRRVNDGYNWKKYEDKLTKGSENQRSYYKCTWPNCVVKKKVEKSIDGEIIETIYKGTHNHGKPVSVIKRNSSSEYLYSLLPSDQSFASHGSEQLDSDAESENSSVSV